jgi:integrase
VTLFFNSNWSLRYNAHGRRLVESLGTQDDRLAWAELLKAGDERLDGKSPQEIVGAKHHTTSTVAEAAKRFVTDYTTISLGTHRKMRRVLQAWVIGEDVHPKTGTWTPRADAHIARPFGRLETHVVAGEDVKTLLARVRQTVNQYGRPNSQGFARQVLDAVRLLFNWLIDEGLLKGKDGRVLANPAARAGKFTFDAAQDSKVDAEASGEEVHVFEPEPQQKLEAWFDTYCRRLFPMVLTGFGAGLRYGEVIALELDDIDLTRHVVKVTKHWTPDGVVKGTKSNRLAKGKLRTRTVPTNLDPRLEPALEAHIATLKADPRRDGTAGGCSQPGPSMPPQPGATSDRPTSTPASGTGPATTSGSKASRSTTRDTRSPAPVCMREPPLKKSRVGSGTRWRSSTGTTPTSSRDSSRTERDYSAARARCLSPPRHRPGPGRRRSRWSPDRSRSGSSRTARTA